MCLVPPVGGKCGLEEVGVPEVHVACGPQYLESPVEGQKGLQWLEVPDHALEDLSAHRLEGGVIQVVLMRRG